MGAIIPEIKTRVKVEANTSEIDKCISSIDSAIFAPVIEQLTEIKTKINDGAEEVADKVSEGLKSCMEMWIIQNKTIDTEQMINTLFIEPSGQNSYEVGPTALSQDGFPYPLVIEMGSKYYPGKPFIEPSVANISSDINGIVKAEITDKL